MPMSRAKVEKLLSESEIRLYEASRRGSIGEQGASRLRKLLEATKKQQEKQNTLAKKQLTGRGGEVAANTRLKQDLFADIATRLDKGIKQADASASKAAAKTARGPARKKASKGAKRGGAPTRALKKAVKARAVKARAHASNAPEGAARKRMGQVAAERAHLAHASARGRRTQAKRDRKGR